MKTQTQYRNRPPVLYPIGPNRQTRQQSFLHMIRTGRREKECAAPPPGPQGSNSTCSDRSGLGTEGRGADVLETGEILDTPQPESL